VTTDPYLIKRGTDLQESCTSVLAQGRGKSGKTTFACTWPDPLIISVDPNRAPFATFPDVQVIVAPTVGVIESRILPDLKAGKIEARTVVLDSLSFFSDHWADRLMGTRTSYAQGQGQQASVSLRRFMLQFIELKTSPNRPYNIVVTCHDAPRSEGEDGPKRIEPVTIGALRESIARYFDLVLLFEKESRAVTQNGKAEIVDAYKARTIAPDQHRVAGGSLWGRKLPAVIEPPTYQQLRKSVGLTVDFEPKVVVK